jgi:hypothetical protein
LNFSYHPSNLEVGGGAEAGGARDYLEPPDVRLRVRRTLRLGAGESVSWRDPDGGEVSPTDAIERRWRVRLSKMGSCLAVAAATVTGSPRKPRCPTEKLLVVLRT